MIVGNGLIAQAFKQQESLFENVIIFASGVSNSKNNHKSEYTRELNKIKQYSNTTLKFIYFSSIHVLDPSQKDKSYFKFKFKVETYIKQNFSNYIIYRLPVIMGNGGYKYSLFNFLHDSIMNQKEMQIHINAHRYIMDIENMVFFVAKTIYIDNQIINFVFDKPFNIIDIISSYEKVLNIQAIYKLVDGGIKFNVDNNKFKKILNRSDLKEFTLQSYLEKIIRKYYS